MKSISHMIIATIPIAIMIFLYSYDSGGHLMDTTKSYHQAVEAK